MPKYCWFVDPDEYTNRVICQMLPAENAKEEIRCFLVGGEEVRRNLWECDRHILLKLERSRDSRLGYKIFVQRVGGQIREWPFAVRKPRARVQKSPNKNQPVAA